MTAAILNSHFPLGKCHFISHTYLWYHLMAAIFLLITPQSKSRFVGDGGRVKCTTSKYD
jgi:hypothetical protein